MVQTVPRPSCPRRTQQGESCFHADWVRSDAAAWAANIAGCTGGPRSVLARPFCGTTRPKGPRIHSTPNLRLARQLTAPVRADGDLCTALQPAGCLQDDLANTDRSQFTDAKNFRAFCPVEQLPTVC